MNKTKILFTLWFIIVVMILGLLTTIGFMYKKLDKEYQKLETKLLTSGENYSNANSYYPEDNLELIITKDELVSSSYLDELKVKNDVCDGYVLVTKEDVYHYKAYIKCKNYETDGYKDNIK